MTLKCFSCWLALMICIPLAVVSLNADDLATDEMTTDEIAADEPATDDPATDAHDEYNAYYGYGHTAEELIFVAAYNEYRVSRGLNPVALCSELSMDCRRWSTHMRQRGQLSHDPMGGGMEICAQISYESGLRALQVWQRSPAHHAILVSPRIDTIGIGSDGIWWTMRGRQRGAERTERTVFRMPTDVRSEVQNDTEIEYIASRVPMSVSGNSSQSVTGDVQRGGNIRPFRFLFR